MTPQPSTLAVGTRVASFDIGSNTVIMLIAERGAEGWHVVTDEAEITRVSEGLDKHGSLFREGLERTAEALIRFDELAQDFAVHHRIATGTAPFRRASNGTEAAVELSLLIGTPIDVVSGEHEAELSLLATRGSFPELSRAQIVDIGGASTELIDAFPDGSHAVVSLDVGAVRLTERCVTADPISAAERAALQTAIDEALSRASVRKFVPAPLLVGVAGTVTTLAALSLEMDEYEAERVHGHLLSRAEVGRIENALFALSLSQRKSLPGMPAKRADVLPAGAMLLRSVMDHLGATEVRVSDRGIRWGRLFERYGV